MNEITHLLFTGVLDCPSPNLNGEGTLVIGGQYVWEAIEELRKTRATFVEESWTSFPVEKLPPIEITLVVGGDEGIHATGQSYSFEGEIDWSDWTPGAPPSWEVGDQSILEDIYRYDGQVVTLRVDLA